MERKGWRPALTSILVAELVGQVGSLLAGNIGLTYSGLVKPPLSPPGWVFAPVWIVLYAMMGYAAYRVWSEMGWKDRGIRLYMAQLLVNGLWSVVFFRFGALWLAVVVIVALDLLIWLTYRAFCEVDGLAGRLMLPYLAWTLFATYLTMGFALLN